MTGNKLISFTRPAVFCVCMLSLTAMPGCTDSRPQVMPEIPVASDAEAESVEPDQEEASAEPGITASVSGTRRKYTGISFEIPDSWTDQQAQMVDSKYLVSTEKGNIEITLTSMGGGIQANLDRWVKQVRRDRNDEPEWSKLDVAGVESEQVDVRGRYASAVGGDTGTRQQTRLIGIAVPLPLRDFFIKLVGPREAMVDFDSDLSAFLKTAKRED